MEIIKKRRQHHVWQRYLKSWTVDDKIYCLKYLDGSPGRQIEAK
jgi:hypothetical protein